MAVRRQGQSDLSAKVSQQLKEEVKVVQLRDETNT
jgi:hypothetical protein